MLDDLDVAVLQSLGTECEQRAGVVNLVRHHCGPHQMDSAVNIVGESTEAHVSPMVYRRMFVVCPLLADTDTDSTEPQDVHSDGERVSYSDHEEQSLVALPLGDDGNTGELDLSGTRVDEPSQEDSREAAVEKDAEGIKSNERHLDFM